MHFWIDLSGAEEDQRVVHDKAEFLNWPRIEIGVDTEKEELLIEGICEDDGLGPASIGIARIPFDLIQSLLRKSIK